MGKELDHGTNTAEANSFYVKLFKNHPHLDTPEFRACYAHLQADQLAQKQRDAQVLEAYRNRPKPKFSELPFVGKKYRSRNRRSADKMTAWAVKPEPGEVAAIQGFEYARQFMHALSARTTDGREPWAGYGISLENIIVGMADTLSGCKPSDEAAHLKVIRGFCSAMELAAIAFVDSNSADEQFNAATYQLRMAHLDNHKPHVFDCNSQPWKCEVEKHRMLT